MSRIPIVFTLFLCMICLAVSACAPTVAVRKAPVNPEAMKIANAYGIGNFKKISAIRYTFNVNIRDTHIRRKWIWEPETDRVWYQEHGPDGKTVERDYLRSDAKHPDFDKKTDERFINDQYRLLFPFHLVWDDVKIVSGEDYPLPILSGHGKRLTVTYPPGSGHTSGDVYEIYYGPDYLIQQWVYRKGGAEKPTRITTWEEHAKAGPILVSLIHKNRDGSFRLWFSDVAVRLKGSTVWLPALIY